MATNTRTQKRSIPIRLDDRLISRLQTAASRMGSTTSGMIRFAVIQQLPEIESGRLTLKGTQETAN